jgi:hypothetical protein
MPVLLFFNKAPDFEVPSDANGDNDYMIVAAVSDSVLSDSKTSQVAVLMIPPMLKLPQLETEL